jgi:hypothetical protein
LYRQTFVEADRTKIEERMQFTRENYRLMRDRLMRIVWWKDMRIVWWKEEYGGKPPANRDVNEAAKNIVMMDLAILQAEAAAGMYKKSLRGKSSTSRLRLKSARLLLRRGHAAVYSLS